MIFRAWMRGIIVVWATEVCSMLDSEIGTLNFYEKGKLVEWHLSLVWLQVVVGILLSDRNQRLTSTCYWTGTPLVQHNGRNRPRHIVNTSLQKSLLMSVEDVVLVVLSDPVRNPNNLREKTMYNVAPENDQGIALERIHFDLTGRIRSLQRWFKLQNIWWGKLRVAMLHA
jgi:hypothetical protein